MTSRARAHAEVVLAGRPWQIEIERLPEHRLAVRVDGRDLALEAEWIDADTLLILIDRVVHRAAIQPVADGLLRIEIGGQTFDAAVSPRSRSAGSRRRHPASRDRASTASGEVKAPMPGRVVRLLAAHGERVNAGQGVVVMEAMKMENELRAPRDGIVTELRVRAGAAVEAGAVLVVVD